MLLNRLVPLIAAYNFTQDIPTTVYLQNYRFMSMEGFPKREFLKRYSQGAYENNLGLATNVNNFKLKSL